MFPQWNQAYHGMDPNQQLYWQQYYGYQQPGAVWSGVAATTPSSSTGGAPISGTAANTLPPEPPKEEAPPPPLPSDPPPPPVPDEAKPPTESNDQKLSALQQQAAQWQQQKQWQEYQQCLLQYQQQLQQWNVQQANILEQINQEESEFEVQYSDWMKQYTDWKEENKHHPNREQYLQYEQQWKQYEEQMAQKRDYIKQRKAQALMNQSMAQATGTQSFSTVEQSTSSLTATPMASTETTTFPVSASASISSGPTYPSSGGQFTSACPPSSTQMYPGYGYGNNFGAGQSQMAAVPRFPPPGGAFAPQGTPGWPPQNMPSAMPPIPGFDSGMRHTSFPSAQHSTPGDTGTYTSSHYGAQRPPNPSSFEGVQAGYDMSHNVQMRHPAPSAVDQSSGVAKGPGFMGKTEIGTPASYPVKEESIQGNRFQHPNANAQFPGPPGPGMPHGAYGFGSRPQGIPGPPGPIPQGDASVSSTASIPFGTKTDSDVNRWDSGVSGAPNEQAPSNFMGQMGQSHFPNHQSTEFCSTSIGPYGPQSAMMSQGSRPLRPNSSDPASLDLGFRHPGTMDPRWRPPVNPPNSSTDGAPFSGPFNSRSSFTRPSVPQFPGPQMADQFKRFDNEQKPFQSGELQGRPQFPTGGRFPGADNGMPRFQGNFSPGTRPPGEHMLNTGNARFQGPHDPSFASEFENEEGFSDANYHGPGLPGPRPGLPGPRPDFKPETEFGGPRFPGPRGPRDGLNVRHQHPIPGGARFMGPPGLRMGSDVANDSAFGESRFPGPRFSIPRPDLESGESFSNSPSLGFNKDFRFGRPRAPGQFDVGFGQEIQENRMKFEPRGQLRMTSDPRFQFQGLRMSNDQQPFSSDGKRPEHSGPVPLLSLTGLAPSSGTKTSVFDSTGRSLHSQTASVSLGSQLPGNSSKVSEFDKTASKMPESLTESGSLNPSDAQSKSAVGLKSSSYQPVTSMTNTLAATVASSSAGPKAFELSKQGGSAAFGQSSLPGAPTGVQPFRPGLQPRFQGRPEFRGRYADIQGPRSAADEVKFTRWQAPTGMMLEEEAAEVDQRDSEAMHRLPIGFNRAGLNSGPRFPAPGPNIGRGNLPAFPRGPILPNRPQFGTQADRMRPDFPASGRFQPPLEISEGADGDIISEEQEDFSKDYGEEGFFGKRKSSEIMAEGGYEEEGAQEAAPKIGRMEPGAQPPFPRMPAGRGLGQRGPPIDVNMSRFGAPVMRPRFDLMSGNMVRPRGPVPLMQLSLRPSVGANPEQEPAKTDPRYQPGEFPQEGIEEDRLDEAQGLDRFPAFGPRGPSGIRSCLPGQPRMPFEPRGIPPRWPRPRMEEMHPRLGRGGIVNMRGPFNSFRGRAPPGHAFRHPHFGNQGANQEEHPEEAYAGIQPPDIEYDEDGNPIESDQRWITEDYEEDPDMQNAYAAIDETDQVEGEGLPIQFSERQHELIKKAAEELKLLRQKQDQLDVLDSIAPVIEKPKAPVSTLVPYASDEVADELENVHEYREKRQFLDRDDRFIENERIPPENRGRSRGEEGYQVDDFEADPYMEEWNEDFPRRPLPPDFEFRGPPREFEQRWPEDQGLRDERFPRHIEDTDRRHFDGRWGPPPDWERRSPPFPPERGPRGLPPLPNPREFLDTFDGHPPRPPSFGRGPRPPFEPFPPPGGSAAVFDYGHGGSGKDAFSRSELRAGRDDFWPERDEDMRFMRFERDSDFRHEREPSDYEQDRRHPHPDVHRRPGWQDFPDFHDRERVSKGRDYDHRGSREASWNRDHRSSLDFHEPERDQDFRDRDHRRGLDQDEFRERIGRSGGFKDPFSRPPVHGNQGPGAAGFVEEIKIDITAVDDLLMQPGRRSRPDHIVVIIRGPPGAGKTFVSKLLKDREVANGGTAPRMLCLDDYFMVETEKVVEDPETGKNVKKMIMEYEYDAVLEPAYKGSFLKSFRRQIDDCYFNFIIVDAIFDKIDYLDEFWSYAKSKGFQVYVVEMMAEVGVCAKRNIHLRNQAEIQKIVDGWDETPRHYIRLDVRSLLQDAAIMDVEMEDTADDVLIIKSDDEKAEEADEEVGLQGLKKSKWEMDTSEQQLDKLDGIRAGMKKHEVIPQRLEDYLQLPDDYDTRKSEPGKKRVRWADIEERKDQLRRRELGFVIGQTDWAKMTDDTYADKALNRTKYF